MHEVGLAFASWWSSTETLQLALTVLLLAVLVLVYRRVDRLEARRVSPLR